MSAASRWPNRGHRKLLPDIGIENRPSAADPLPSRIYRRSGKDYRDYAGWTVQNVVRIDLLGSTEASHTKLSLPHEGPCPDA